VQELAIEAARVTANYDLQFNGHIHQAAEKGEQILSRANRQPEEGKGSRGKHYFWFFFACAASLLAGGVLWLSGMPREAAFMSGIFVLAALLWVTEALPLFATSLLVIGLQLLFLSNPGDWRGLGYESGDSPDFRTVLANAADPVLLLFFGGFLLARAAVKEGVDRAMGGLLLRLFGGSAKMVLLGLMLVTALFSMWMSNTAATAMMMALVIPLLAQLPPGDTFRKGMVLAVPFAANIGGLGTPIASPPNAVALGFLQQAGFQINFIEWMLVAFPLMLGMIAFAWGLLWIWHRPAVRDFQLRLDPQPLNRRGWHVVGVFTVTVVLWMSDRWHGLPPSVVALLPAVVFTASGLLDRTDVNSLEWNILILIAGGISLGTGLQMTGLDKLIVQWLPFSERTPLIWVVASLSLATLLLGTFMSNTAAANLLLPLGISAAMIPAAGDPTGIIRVGICIALSASMSMALPISTPPNAIAYSSGEIQTRDMAAPGILLGIAALFLIVAFSGVVLRFWGLGQ
jgi:solute carrier family 13 (sodium-dependent dicarboxylate transporter), member 2/3/5